jgi:hypothetical protein
MRRGLFFILMVVLVLRGLTGTAMAAGLLPPLTLTAAHPEQAHSDHRHGDAFVAAAAADNSSHHLGTHAASPVYEPSAAVAWCEGATNPCDPDEHHMSSCPACEICHSAMLTLSVPLAQAAIPVGHSRPLACAPFHSALAALTIKPPIA